MITEHYDLIEILHKKEIESRRSGFRTYCVVAYVVRESSTPMRVGYPGEIAISLRGGGLLREPFAALYAAEVGDQFRARFAEAITAPGNVPADLRLDQLWEAP